MSVAAHVAPQNPLFWFASLGTTYQHIRELLLAILLVQLVTRPPRHVWFRILTGAVSIVTITWVIQQSYSFNMLPLDTLSILGASLAIAVTSLERKAINLVTYSHYQSHNE